MKITRRNFLVSAASLGACGGLGALVLNGEASPAFVWRGAALGGEARVSLFGPDREQAHAALDVVAREIDRLEAIFSLHRSDSELSGLNAAGYISAPSRDLRDVLRAAIEWRKATGGAFDPTIQTVWMAAADSAEITPALLATAGTTVILDDAAVTLQQGSKLTLNGIAQGRIADRVTEVLATHGFTDVVIDAGELRLPGRQRRAVGIPAAKAAVSVAEVAIATSEPKSLVFDHATWRHHLIDPRTGVSPRHWESISVFAPTAEKADALSTGFAVMPHEAVADIAQSIGDVAVIGRDGKGRIRRLGDKALFGSQGRTS